MVDTVLKLGDFQFTETEIPERISFGGEQRAAVHQLVGGARVVDSMGRSDAPLSWAGWLVGPGALDRARYLDGLRVDGQQLTLTWSEFSYTVIVQRFEAAFERFYKIPYQISCLVVEDNTKRVRTVTIASHNDAINSDNATAQALGAQVADTQLTGLLGTLDTAIKAVSDFARATTQTINSVLTPIANVQARVGLLITTVGNTARSVTTLGGVLPNNPVAKNVNRMLTQSTAMGQLPALYNLNSVLNRLHTNVYNAGPSAPGRQSITVAGGNLFSLAQQQYGDATQWTTIASANKLSDPMLSGIQTLSIPEQPATSSGGVLGIS
jgi:hypothetical protein